MPGTPLRHRLFAIVLTIAAFSVSAKTVRQYVWAHWQLPNATVLSLAQTTDGYLWIATFEGLARFNGNDFAVFDKRNTPIANTTISALLGASDGTLWIGTAGGGLYRRAGGVITRIVPGTIRALSEDRQHTVWAASDRGIERMSLDGRALALPTGAPRTIVHAICVLGDEVWFATEGDGLVRFASGRFTEYTTADGLSSNVILSLSPSRDGRLIVGTKGGTKGGGLDVFAGGRFETMPVLAKANVVALAEDREGGVWISAEGKGVCHLLGDNIDCAPLTADGDVARSMFVDREGSLWLGGTTSGLHRVTDGAITSTTSETASDSIRSVTQTTQGTIWAGGEGIGLQFLHDNILLGDGRNAWLPSRAVHSVLADRDGTLWIGSTAGLAHVIGAEVKTYTVSDGLAANVVDALEQDAGGSLWIGTSAGVSRLDAGAITTLPSDAPLEVHAVHPDAGGHLWAGTSNGLRCLVNGRLAPCGDGILRDASIFAFHDDARGDLWIGTNRGLVRMRNDKASVYTTHDGLFDDTALSILEDDEGTLWMSCDKGIYRARISDIDAYERHAIPSILSPSYDKSDGMAAAQCNGATQPAAWKGHDGRLWFPTTNGLATVDPKRLPRNTLPPPVVIEQIAVNGHAVPPATLASLAPGSRNLEFHYAALSFVAPEKVRFRYKLEGFDANWIDAGARRVAYYTNVPHGSYRFRVIAANNDGVWNTKGDSLSMDIAAFYYETWWYRALAVLAVLIIIAIFYRARLWQVRRNERHLKAIVDEQTEELREANAALEELAAIDPLTQVANRRSLDAALARMWAEHSRTGGSLAAILCDIDHFKKYNDTYGHQGGDETLIRVARALASSVPRSTDIVARFGGEEFVILLGHCTRDEATLVAARVLDSVRSLAIAHATSPTAPHVTVSLGVAAIVPDASAAPENLIREADEALYRAKEGGRDGYGV